MLNKPREFKYTPKQLNLFGVLIGSGGEYFLQISVTIIANYRPKWLVLFLLTMLYNSTTLVTVVIDDVV